VPARGRYRPLPSACEAVRALRAAASARRTPLSAAAAALFVEAARSVAAPAGLSDLSPTTRVASRHSAPLYACHLLTEYFA
jgi:hypothetical protein